MSVQLSLSGFHTENTMHASRSGDLAEYYAVTWLWDNGYEVFPNAGCTGPVDIVAMKDGKVTLIDVKTERNNNGTLTKTGSRTPLQIELGVIILAFNPDTRTMRFVKHREDSRT